MCECVCAQKCLCFKLGLKRKFVIKGRPSKNTKYADDQTTARHIDTNIIHACTQKKPKKTQPDDDDDDDDESRTLAVGSSSKLMRKQK